MKNMDKGLTVPKCAKWVLINRPKILPKPQNVSAQIVCQSPKVWDFDEKRLHWESVVRGIWYSCGKFELIHNGNLSIFEVAFLIISCQHFFLNLENTYYDQRVGLQNEFDPIVKSGVQDCIGHISLPGPSQGLKFRGGGRSSVVGISAPWLR